MPNKINVQHGPLEVRDRKYLDIAEAYKDLEALDSIFSTDDVEDVKTRHAFLGAMVVSLLKVLTENGTLDLKDIEAILGRE